MKFSIGQPLVVILLLINYKCEYIHLPEFVLSDNRVLDNANNSENSYDYSFNEELKDVLNFSDPLTDLSQLEFTTSNTFTENPPSLSTECNGYCKTCAEGNICTECLDGYALYSNFCRNLQLNFLQVPVEVISSGNSSNSSNSSTPTNINLKVDNPDYNFTLINENKITITIWIKMIDPNPGSLNNTCVKIFILNEAQDQYLCFDIESSSLLFYYQDTILFYEDTEFDDGNLSFSQFLNQWCLISIISLKTDLEYFNPISRVYIHTTEMQRLEVNTTLPRLQIDSFIIGKEFSALLADFRIYRDFIINPYGYIMSENKDTNNFIKYGFSSAINSDFNQNCFERSNMQESLLFNNSNGVIKFQCVPDFHPFLEEVDCPSNTFLDRINSNYNPNSMQSNIEVPCFPCNPSCLSKMCSGSTLNRCTCINSQPNNLLRYVTIQDSNLKTIHSLSCERIPYKEFSLSDKITLNGVTSANIREYTMELWFYIYSYDKITTHFDSHEIFWDLHNFLKIYTSNSTKNEIKVRCIPVYKSTNNTDVLSQFYLEDVYENGIGKWNYVQCSTQVNHLKTYINNFNVVDVVLSPSVIPVVPTGTLTNLTIRPGQNAKTNYGLLFIRELRLWSLYNIRRFDTKCKISSLATYYTDLINYLPNDHDIDFFLREKKRSLKTNIPIRNDFIGYSVFDLHAYQQLLFPSMTVCYGPSNSLTFVAFEGFMAKTKISIKSFVMSDYLYRFYYVVKRHGVDVYEISPWTSKSEVFHTFFIEINKYYYPIPFAFNLQVFCEVKNKDGSMIKLYRDMVLDTTRTTRQDNFQLIFSSMNDNTISPFMTSARLSVRVDALAMLVYDTYNIGTPDNSPNQNNYLYPEADMYGRIKIQKLSCYGNSCVGDGICNTIDSIDICICTGNRMGDRCQFTFQNYNLWMNLHEQLINALYFKFASGATDLAEYLNEEVFMATCKLLNSADLVTDMEAIEANKYFENMDAILLNKYGNVAIEIFPNDCNSTTLTNLTAESIQNTCTNTKTNGLLLNLVENHGGEFATYFDSLFKILNAVVLKKKYFTFVNDTINNNTLSNYTYQIISSRMRRLQNSSEILNPLIIALQITNSSIFYPLDTEEKKIYSDHYKKLFQFLKKFIYINFIIMKNSNSTDNQKFINNKLFFSVQAHKINVNNDTTLSQFYADIDELFYYRKMQRLSYIDPRKCIKEFISMSKNQSLFDNNYQYDFSNIFIGFIGFNLSPFVWDDTIYLQTMTHQHWFQLYDNNLREIKLKCPNSGVIHYLNLFEVNENFMNDYNLYPSKYVHNYFNPFEVKLESNNFIKLPFIYPEHTVSENLIKDQLNIYYPKFSFNMTQYSLEEESEIPDNNMSYLSQDNLIFDGFDNLGYIQGVSFYSGKIYAFTSNKRNYDMSHTIYSSDRRIFSFVFDSYYLQILQNMSNIYRNDCFVFLIIILSLQLTLTLISIYIDSKDGRYETYTSSGIDLFPMSIELSSPLNIKHEKRNLEILFNSIYTELLAFRADFIIKDNSIFQDERFNMNWGRLLLTDLNSGELKIPKKIYKLDRLKINQINSPLKNMNISNENNKMEISEKKMERNYYPKSKTKSFDPKIENLKDFNNQSNSIHHLLPLENDNINIFNRTKFNLRNENAKKFLTLKNSPRKEVSENIILEHISILKNKDQKENLNILQNDNESDSDCSENNQMKELKLFLKDEHTHSQNIFDINEKKPKGIFRHNTEKITNNNPDFTLQNNPDEMFILENKLEKIFEENNLSDESSSSKNNMDKFTTNSLPMKLLNPHRFSIFSNEENLVKFKENLSDNEGDDVIKISNLENVDNVVNVPKIKESQHNVRNKNNETTVKSHFSLMDMVRKKIRFLSEEHKNKILQKRNTLSKNLQNIKENKIEKDHDDFLIMNIEDPNKIINKKDPKTLRNKCLHEFKKYQLIYFIFFRNIWMTSINFSFSTLFTPYIKNISKLFFILYLEFFCTLLLFFGQGVDIQAMDSIPISVITLSKSAKIIIYSVIISNLVIILVSYFFNSKTKEIKHILHKIDRANNSRTPMSPDEGFKCERLIMELRRTNIIKTISINILNTLLFVMLILCSVVFTTVFSKWCRFIIFLWIVTLLCDFFIFEVILEVFIYILWRHRNSVIFKTVMKFFLSIKNLRNIPG